MLHIKECRIKRLGLAGLLVVSCGYAQADAKAGGIMEKMAAMTEQMESLIKDLTPTIFAGDSGLLVRGLIHQQSCEAK